MLKNGKCPQCGSTNIFTNSNGIDYGGDSYQIELWIGSDDNRSDRQSDFISYICTDCGYFENHITDKEILKEIQKKWKKTN
jgi:predicted nucleic-acid-binding Zn-ribbon protein